MPLSAEVYLISSIVKNNQFSLATAEGATPDLFHTHKEEFEWIATYYAKHRKEPSRVAFLRSFPGFRILDCNDTAHFVAEVRKQHTRQLMTASMRDVADLLAEGKVSEAAELTRRDIVKIASGVASATEINPLEDWKPVYNEVKARKARFDEFGMAGIPTGFETLDERTGGIGKGQFWVVGARLGEGKSFTLLRMTVAALLAEHRVHFAALEMSRYEVTMRLHNFLSSAVGKQIYQSAALAQGNGYDLRDYRTFLAELPKRVKGHITISDTRGIGALEIAAQIERNNPDLYFLDYLTLAKTRGDGGWQDIGNFSKELKEMAGRYDVGMVAAAQLNRSGADNSKEPAGAETIAQADAIGQDADAVITMKKLSDRVTMMKLAKYRHGRAGYCWYSFLDLDNGAFFEVSKNRALELQDMDAERRDRDMEQGPSGKVNDRQRSTQGEQIAAYAVAEGSGQTGLRRKK